MPLARPPLVPREEQFTSRLHDERLAARLGLALGISFGICFVTGLLSHYVQHPFPGFVWPTRPVSLYRVTQGVHVVTGVAAVPLLLAKLWTVYPRLFTWPPVRSVAHALERGSVLVLVAAALFQLVTGVQNVASWYPWGFSFPPVHFAMAWVAIGAIVVHVGVQLPAIRRGLGAPADSGIAAPGSPSRRSVLVGSGLAAGVGALAVAGQVWPWLRDASVLASRSLRGPQGLPVTKTAEQAGVVEAVGNDAWRLTVSGPGGEVSLTLKDLEELPQHTARLPVVCVQGWAETAEWTGPRVRDVVALVSDDPGDVFFASLQEGGSYGTSTLPARHVRDDLSLLALRIGGEPLDIDHGYPCRLITSSRPGVLQTKWLSRLEVRA